MLAVDRLLAHAERPPDLLPRPPKIPRVLDLELLQRLQKDAKGRHRRETHSRVATRRVRGERGCLAHRASSYVDAEPLSTCVDEVKALATSES